MVELLDGIRDDVLFILESLSDSLNSPHSPVEDPPVLKDAAVRLDAAKLKAEQLASELDSIENGSKRGR